MLIIWVYLHNRPTKLKGYDTMHSIYFGDMSEAIYRKIMKTGVINFDITPVSVLDKQLYECYDQSSKTNNIRNDN